VSDIVDSISKVFIAGGDSLRSQRSGSAQNQLWDGANSPSRVPCSTETMPTASIEPALAELGEGPPRKATLIGLTLRLKEIPAGTLQIPQPHSTKVPAD
jgi:hypothetical protein